MGAKYFGAAVRRREDPRFLRGEGRFVDDVTLPGLLHAAFLRSPHAHATIARLSADAAKAMPGVVAVFTHADLARWMKPLPLFGAPPPGDAARALASADVVVEETFRIQRYVGMPLEGRGVVAVWDRRDGTLTTWNSTQVSHFVQQGLVTALELPPHRIRVIAPDLGGGFGTKASGYAEDALVPIASIVLSRPVKWVEDRREHMMSAAHARHQTHTIRLGARRDGTILGLVDRIWLDLGAYNAWGVVLPYNTVAHLIGPYRIRDMKVDVRAVVTNKTPNAPYRGAGRPETVFAMDRAVDCLARRLGLDPADVRRKNYIRPEELPFAFGMPYRDR